MKGSRSHWAIREKDKELVRRGLWALIEKERDGLAPGATPSECARRIRTINRTVILMNELGHPGAAEI